MPTQRLQAVKDWELSREMTPSAISPRFSKDIRAATPNRHNLLRQNEWVWKGGGILNADKILCSVAAVHYHPSLRNPWLLPTCRAIGQLPPLCRSVSSLPSSTEIRIWRLLVPGREGLLQTAAPDHVTKRHQWAPVPSSPPQHQKVRQEPAYFPPRYPHHLLSLPPQHEALSFILLLANPRGQIWFVQWHVFSPVWLLERGCILSYHCHPLRSQRI